MGASQARENRYMGREFGQRMAAQQSFNMGNMAGAMGHSAMADSFGGMASKIHSHRMNRNGGQGMPMGPQMGGMGGMAGLGGLGQVPFGPTIGGGPNMTGGMGGLTNSASMPTGLSMMSSAGGLPMGGPGATRAGVVPSAYNPGATVTASGWDGMGNLGGVNNLGGMNMMPYDYEGSNMSLRGGGPMMDGFSNGYFTDPSSLAGNYVAPSVYDIGLSSFNGLETVAGNCEVPQMIPQQPLMLVPMCNPNQLRQAHPNPTPQRRMSIVPPQPDVQCASPAPTPQRLTPCPVQCPDPATIQRRLSVVPQPQPEPVPQILTAKPAPIQPTPLLQSATPRPYDQQIKPTPLKIEEIEAPSVGSREPPLAESTGLTKVVSTW